jgi:hypothetical protein
MAAPASAISKARAEILQQRIRHPEKKLRPARRKKLIEKRWVNHNLIEYDLWIKERGVFFGKIIACVPAGSIFGGYKIDSVAKNDIFHINLII